MLHSTTHVREWLMRHGIHSRDTARRKRFAQKCGIADASGLPSQQQ
jgi:hypothetical protein